MQQAGLRGFPLPQAFGFELAAGGENIAAARGSDRRRIAGPVHDIGKRGDILVGRTFIRRTRPGIERNEVDLGGNAADQPHQFARIRRGVVHPFEHHVFERDPPIIT